MQLAFYTQPAALVLQFRLLRRDVCGYRRQEIGHHLADVHGHDSLQTFSYTCDSDKP